MRGARRLTGHPARRGDAIERIPCVPRSARKTRKTRAPRRLVLSSAARPW
ncbi:Hypothetical protein A7982_03120 [Minicystis rosea]|nr:Hypothetical protein A7982_03120 [Minicystis rosea]